MLMMIKGRLIMIERRPIWKASRMLIKSVLISDRKYDSVSIALGALFVVFAYLLLKINYAGIVTFVIIIYFCSILYDVVTELNPEEKERCRKAIEKLVNEFFPKSENKQDHKDDEKKLVERCQLLEEQKTELMKEMAFQREVCKDKMRQQEEILLKEFQLQRERLNDERVLSLRQQMNKLWGMKDDLIMERDSLKAINEQLIEKMSSLEAALATDLREVKYLHEDIAVLQVLRKKLEAENSKLNEFVKQQRLENEELNEIVKQQRFEKDEIKRDMVAYKERVDELVRQLEESLVQIDEMKVEQDDQSKSATTHGSFLEVNNNGNDGYEFVEKFN